TDPDPEQPTTDPEQPTTDPEPEQPTTDPDPERPTTPPAPTQPSSRETTAPTPSTTAQNQPAALPQTGNEATPLLAFVGLTLATLLGSWRLLFKRKNE
ncbi:LPXTG cell wall anchor domain-containing protein, partial [Limosilactobacillus ingluviei]|uniref:LPXTG cell wall anchor domain-containing protein n=1 Tax=Limosilactobacillus ingluviei TaxID=148604 RepID=UPI00128F4037